MHRNLSLDRITVDFEHNLTIKNITNEDAGLYYCHGPSGPDVYKKYNYAVDGKNFQTIIF